MSINLELMFIQKDEDRLGGIYLMKEDRYCGLDCEKCDAYIATVNDDQALREKTAKSWAELNKAPILPEHINWRAACGRSENSILPVYV